MLIFVSDLCTVLALAVHPSMAFVCATPKTRVPSRDLYRRVRLAMTETLRPLISYHHLLICCPIPVLLLTRTTEQMYSASSPPRSPARKRQRLSSPTYDEQLGDLSQEDFAELDKVDLVLSQKSSQTTFAKPWNKRDDEDEEPMREGGLDLRPSPADVSLDEDVSLNEDVFFAGPSARDEPDNPFGPALGAGFASASTLAANKHRDHTMAEFPSFKPASAALAAYEAASSSQQHTSSPEHAVQEEEDQERDFSTWFTRDPDTENSGPIASFAAASSVMPSAPVQGFMKASNKGWMEPSKAALERAKEKLKEWQDAEPEVDEVVLSQPITKDVPLPSAPPPVLQQSRVVSPRPVLRAVENSYTPGKGPNTPTPAGTSFGRATLGGGFGPRGKGTPKPFKSPLLLNTAAPFRSPAQSSPLNPSRAGPGPSSSTGFATASEHHPASASEHHRLASASEHHPLASAPITATSTPITATTPVRKPVPPASTPIRSLGLTPRGGVVRGTPGKPKFVTPFKAGMKPGQPGRAVLATPVKVASTIGKGKSAAPVPTPASVKDKGKERWKAFDLSSEAR
ncbi:hypothetical protein PLICRDRAFT_422975 [Plicaturopsis crispa FD-325 SS-3]|nr:hypothetical protein PLICRDRAFT_422975 [Plicaturopsis crispa FD-325 SS-3]